jgi:hypothetical protein
MEGIVKRVAVLLFALLGLAACGDESKAPTGEEGTREPDAKSQSRPRKRPAVDPERNASAYEAEVVAQGAEQERGVLLALDRKRVSVELVAARGDEPAFRAVVQSLKARWRAKDPDRYAQRAAGIVATLNGHDWGLGRRAAKTVQREVALDALALGDSLQPGLEAVLARYLSQTVGFRESGSKEHALPWRTRFAAHWVRAWSRLINELRARRTPPPKIDSMFRYGPFPEGLSPMTNGSAPPYLMDPIARAKYDHRLTTYYAGVRENVRRDEIKAAMDLNVPMLRRYLIRIYRLKPSDHAELRKLLATSSLSPEEQSRILKEVGAK